MHNRTGRIWRCDKGVTMVELLVVLALVGMLAAVATLNLSPRDETDKALDAFAAELNHIRRAASHNASPHALFLSQDHYQFAVRTLGRWQAHAISKNPIPWPKGSEIIAYMAGTPLEMAATQSFINDQPQLVFYPGSGAVPFSLRIMDGAGGKDHILRWDGARAYDWVEAP